MVSVTRESVPRQSTKQQYMTRESQKESRHGTLALICARSQSQIDVSLGHICSELRHMTKQANLL
jgi:hypothetical protein